MKGDPEERAAAVGRYIVESGATVRAAAAVFGVSKSTIWKDQHRLRRQNPGLWAEVQAVVQKNKAERHLRGGDGVIARRLHDDAQRIEKHRLKGQIVGHLRNRRIRPESILKKRNHLIGIGITAVKMLQRDIKSAVLGHGERNPYNAGPVRIQRRPRIVPVLQ